MHVTAKAGQGWNQEREPQSRPSVRMTGASHLPHLRTYHEQEAGMESKSGLKPQHVGCGHPRAAHCASCLPLNGAWAWFLDCLLTLRRTLQVSWIWVNHWDSFDFLNGLIIFRRDLVQIRKGCWLGSEVINTPVSIPCPEWLQDWDPNPVVKMLSHGHTGLQVNYLPWADLPSPWNFEHKACGNPKNFSWLF